MTLACHPQPKKRWPSPCWRIRHGATCPRTFRRRLEPTAQPSWARSAMPSAQPQPFSRSCCHPERSEARAVRSRRTRIAVALLLAAYFLLFDTSCARKPDPNTLVMVIESSPTNLDPRVGIDAQAERIGELIFDSLVRRDEHFELKPWLAESWEIPDPQTYVFHLRKGVRFHNGQPLTSRDVKWTPDSLLTGRIRSSKVAAYNKIDHIDAPDDYTVIVHLKEPIASLLWNLSDGAIGIVPYGSGEEFSRNPIGSGPFRFVSAQQDKEVVIERSSSYWETPAKLQR